MLVDPDAVASFNGCEINDNQAEDVCACLLKLPGTFFQRPAGTLHHLTLSHRVEARALMELRHSPTAQSHRIPLLM